MKLFLGYQQTAGESPFNIKLSLSGTSVVFKDVKDSAPLSSKLDQADRGEKDED